MRTVEQIMAEHSLLSVAAFDPTLDEASKSALALVCEALMWAVGNGPPVSESVGKSQ